MRSSSRIPLIAILCASLFVLPIFGQQQDNAGIELLRQKIEQLENTDIKSKSNIVQDFYKRTLFRLYTEYAAALVEDINALTKIRDIARGTRSDPQSEIATQIQQLNLELSTTEEKLKTLRLTWADSPRSAAPRTTLSNSSANVSSPAGPLLPMAVTSSPGISLQPSVNNVPAAAATPTPTVRLCGQIKPASLVQIWALLESSPSLMDALKRDASASIALSKARFSSLPGDCVNADEGSPLFLKVGDQKEAVIRVLQALLSNPKLAKSGLPNVSRATIERQILLLNGYIGNAIVHVDSTDGTLNFTPRANKDGNYEVDLTPGATGTTYIVSTEADNDYTKRTIVIHPGDGSVRLDIPIEDRPVSLLTRAFVGYEQSGAAAAKHEQNYFFDLFVSHSFPFKQEINPDFGEKLRTWVDFRFGSVPQSGDATLGEFSSGFATQVSSLKVKDVARVFEFLGGIEYRLTGNSNMLPSFDRLTKQKFSISFIAAAGVTTPLNPLESISTFKVTPGAPGLPPQAIGKDFVAFVQSDRDRFFRQYYVGLRMQTFFFNLFNMPMQRFPSQVDIAIGQNEFVTGGRLKGPVLRIDGFFPLPYDKLKFINLFGTAMLRPGHVVTGIPLLLEPAPAGTVVPAANVALIALPQPNRDYYRVGFGIDLASLVQKWVQSQKK